MADKIGSIDLHMVEAMTVGARRVKITGHHDTYWQRQELEEMFTDAEMNIAIHIIPGGDPEIEDMTDNERFTQWCIFDSSRLKDGFYALQRFDKGIDDELGIFSWAVEIFLMGSELKYKRGQDYGTFTEVTNDWGI